MDLKTEDLVTKCQKCNGTGWFKETFGGSGFSRTNEGTCMECGGMGGFLTEAGLAVTEVVKLLKRRGEI